MPSFGVGVIGASPGPVTIPCQIHPRAPVTFIGPRAYSTDIFRRGTAMGDSSASVVTSRTVSAAGSATASSGAAVVARAVYVDPGRLFEASSDARRFAVGEEDRRLDVANPERTLT